MCGWAWDYGPVSEVEFSLTAVISIWFSVFFDFFLTRFLQMFWTLLGYTVAKAPTNPRNSIWFTKLFLLVRGWGLGTRVGMTNKIAQKWLTLIGISSFSLLSFHLAIKGQFVSYCISVMLSCITYSIFGDRSWTLHSSWRNCICNISIILW